MRIRSLPFPSGIYRSEMPIKYICRDCSLRALAGNLVNAPLDVLVALRGDGAPFGIGLEDLRPQG